MSNRKFLQEGEVTSRKGHKAGGRQRIIRPISVVWHRTARPRREFTGARNRSPTVVVRFLWKTFFIPPEWWPFQIKSPTGPAIFFTL